MTEGAVTPTATNHNKTDGGFIMTASNVTENSITDSMMIKIYETKHSLIEEFSFIKSLTEVQYDDLCTGLAYFINTAPLEEVKKLAENLRNNDLLSSNKD